MKNRPASPCVSLAARWKGADTYRHACARLGQQPNREICVDLCEHGALVADLRLCRQEIETICIFLREAPVGVYQLVLYDGRMFFGTDERYRVKLRSLQRRSPQSALCDEPLRRQLLIALEVFCSARGGGTAVLELTGLPLGRHVQHLAILTRCFPQLPSLQRLHLDGCNMHDRGLTTILPHLKDKLPKLSHLSLARNNLQSVRLIAHLLNGRAAAQRKRKVVPLNVFDISENPHLGAFPQKSLKLTSALQPVPPLATKQRKIQQSLGCWRTPEQGMVLTRKALLEVICEALHDGLLLRILHLRSMDLTREDLCPLLQFLFSEMASQQEGFFSALPLVSVNLDGNPLEPEFPATITHTLQQLTETGLRAPGGVFANSIPESRPDLGQQRPPVRARSL